ncbi:13887_t:CDS:2, partial [Funneliformis geosporum]
MIDFLRKAGMCISIIELIPKPEDNTISLSQTVKGSSSIIKAEEFRAYRQLRDAGADNETAVEAIT